MRIIRASVATTPLLVLAALATGCHRPTGPPIPIRAPPDEPAVRVTCPLGTYLRGGRYYYRQGRYVWKRPICVARPARWVAGCGWQRGRWVKRSDRFVFQAGALRCPPGPAGPAALPPPRRDRPCPKGKILVGARWSWAQARWVWNAGRCERRPVSWFGRCSYHHGRWSRRGDRIVWQPPAEKCPRLRPKPAWPVALPPAQPKWTPPRCKGFAARWVVYPGHHRWDPLTRTWTWNGPVCVGIRAGVKRPGCKLLPGGWTLRGRRAYYTRPALECPGRPLAYIHRGGKITVGRSVPVALPPRRPAGARTGGCGRGPIFFYPGHYEWDGLRRRYLWREGKCLGIPRRFRVCRFVRGTWRLHKDGAHYRPAGWQCPGKALIPYSRLGRVIETPTPRCTAGWRCVRRIIRPTPKRCAPGTRWRPPRPGLRGACVPMPRRLRGRQPVRRRGRRCPITHIWMKKPGKPGRCVPLVR